MKSLSELFTWVTNNITITKQLFKNMTVAELFPLGKIYIKTINV